MSWLILVLTLACAAIAYGLWRRRRARRLTIAPLSESSQGLLAERLPHYAKLTAEQRDRLYAHVQRFLAEKRFIGCNGFEMTDDTRILIAGMASLLILRPDARVYPRLRSVLVYPQAFWVRHDEPDELGLVDDEPSLTLGESWSGARVVLSWEDIEAALAGDEVNVVAHEFAHQLDDENPATEGAPLLPDYTRWSRVMQAAYAQLRRRRSPVLDEYGAESPGEFFPVATEAYFQRGAELRARHPELYELLRDYYLIETASE